MRAIASPAAREREKGVIAENYSTVTDFAKLRG